MRYSTHSRSTKMYQNLKGNFWWNNIEREIAYSVTRCLACRQIKAKHQTPRGFLRPLEILEWKWKHITMDFVFGLLSIRKHNNVIWVIIDGGHDDITRGHGDQVEIQHSLASPNRWIVRENNTDTIMILSFIISSKLIHTLTSLTCTT